MLDAFIAIDWGTSNRRVFAVDAAGFPVASMCDARGALSMAREEYPTEIALLREQFASATVLAAGMVGSSHGWINIPYVLAPAGLDDLAAALVEAAPGIFLVPGVAIGGDRHDVMRGEEVQVLGAINAGLAPADALFCQPGTHNKWVETEDGRIVRFVTAMTGEIFGLLKRSGTLAGLLDGEVMDDAHFLAGLERGAGATDLTAALFEVRAQVLLGARAVADAASYASGILIGADIGAHRDLAGRPVHLLGTGPLALLYATALRWAGVTLVVVDAEAAFVAGAAALRKHLP